MARRTKKPKKLKKLAVEQKQDEVLEFNGFSIGQKVWAKKYPDNKIISGEITQFYLKDSHGPCIEIRDEKIGCYRTVLLENVSDKPIKRSRKS